MTVNEVLASGEYADRRGREWRHIHQDGRWFYEPDGMWFKDGRKVIRVARADEMRLLIERDQHRDECVGLWDCTDHPVPVVHVERGAFWVGVPGSPYAIGARYVSLWHAMNAAYRLAVSG